MDLTTEQLSQLFRHEAFVRKYIRKKYKISPMELNLLLYLYHERKAKILELKRYGRATIWMNATVDTLYKRGLVEVAKRSRFHTLTMYSPTRAADIIVEDFFDTLKMNKGFRLRDVDNPMLKSDRGYAVHYNSLYMKRFNQEREQRLAQGSRDEDGPQHG